MDRTSTKDSMTKSKRKYDAYAPESLIQLHRLASNEIVHPSFGAILQKYRKQNGATQTALAEILGLPGGDIQSEVERRLLSNFRKLSPVGQNVVEKMASIMLHEEELARDELLRDSYMLLEEHSTPVAAGTGCKFNNEPPEYYFVRKNGYNEQANAVVRVSGASMDPLYHNGDLLYIQYTDYADGAVVKRLRNRKLYSLNKDLPFGKKNEDDHVRIIGRVLGVVSSGDLPNEEDIPILKELMSEEIREFCEKHRIE